MNIFTDEFNFYISNLIATTCGYDKKVTKRVKHVVEEGVWQFWTAFTEDANSVLALMGECTLKYVLTRYLYSKFPILEETKELAIFEMSLGVLSSNVLNEIATEIGIDKYLKPTSDPGKVLRALFGAINIAFEGYFEHNSGFNVCDKFIRGLYDQREIVLPTTNNKTDLGKIIARFPTLGKLTYVDHLEENMVKLYLDEKLIGMGRGFNSEIRQQAAAYSGLLFLHEKLKDFCELENIPIAC